MRITRRPVRIIVIVAIAVVGAAALLYAGRVGYLWMGVTEGDVPHTATVPIPDGSRILHEEKECASNGCWLSLEVQPPDGVSPEQLGTTPGMNRPDVEIPGTIWDPRTTLIGSRVDGDALRVRVSYW